MNVATRIIEAGPTEINRVNRGTERRRINKRYRERMIIRSHRKRGDKQRYKEI